MTRTQVKWAAQHDWYMGATTFSGEAYSVQVIDGRKVLTFTNLKRLYVWAGY